MSSLVKKIEQYLKSLLKEQEAIELQRNELAMVFDCAPSQINYVLSTRFTPSHGYIVESRRGGGGYIRIVRLTWQDIEEPIHYLDQLLCFECSQLQGEGLIELWLNNGLLTLRETKILETIISNDTLNTDIRDTNRLRAKLLRAALIASLRLDSD